ncbi:MAG: glycosyltransferase [Methylotenera sp.]|nr:glycosyltransferase [Methylotenera sp.]
MKFIFLHQNFPGQFPHIASYLAREGHQVISMSQAQARGLAGVQNIVYKPSRGATKGIHHYLIGAENAILNGQAVARTMQALKQKGFVPDVVIGHAGWGETLYVKDVFPETKLINYLEFFYHATGADTGFDPEFPNQADDFLRIRTKNIVNLLSLDGCDAGISPTQWQKSQYPLEYQPKISVIHEGINTAMAKPNPTASVTLPNGRVLTSQDKVVTYVARSLEPYRGFHIFMRALALICQRQPDYQVLIIGADEVSYGRRQEGKTYKEQMLSEVSIDESRVHFLGRLPHDQFTTILQISSAHIYLTVPFVLSWSMLEAMAIGCLVIGSNTPPVREIIEHEKNGLLVDFFDPQAIADAVDLALNQPEQMKSMRRAASQYIQENYPIEKSIMQYKHLIQSLTGNTI